MSGFILIDNYDGDLSRVTQVSVDEAASTTGANNVQFIDVRRPAEFDAGHPPGSVNIPLNKLADRVGEIDPTIPAFVICQGGYRSSIGTGILENAGVRSIYNVTGGTTAWVAAGLRTSSEPAETEL